MITNLGRVMPVPRGIYSSSAVYRTLDIVSSGGSSYLAVFSGDFSNKPPSNAEYWMLLAAGSVSGVIDAMYPVGIVLEFDRDINPNDAFPGTTWEQFGKGRSTIGVDDGDIDFILPGMTGGEKAHALTAAEGPPHIHSVPGRATAGALGAWAAVAFPNNTGTGGTMNTQSSGEGASHNTLHPYITVFRWVRTA